MSNNLQQASSTVVAAMQALVLICALVFATGVARASNDLCTQPASDPYFESYQCPLAAEAAWNADPARLQGTSKAQFIAWANGMAGTMYDPSTVFQVGPEIRAELDPRFPRQLELKTVTADEVLRGTATEAFGIIGKMLKEFTEERRRQQSAGEMDPMAEMQALFGGVANTPAPIIWARRLGETDGYRWVALAQQDPGAALAFYRGLRILVEAM